MSAKRFFAKDYAEARAKFLDAAAAAGGKVHTFKHPEKGPDGGALATDVLRIGSPNARKVVVIQSATHGVEGFCGSGTQVGWLRLGDWKKLPDGVAVVLVHAINPHGFAWIRRVTQENVDLNRNFPDFGKLPRRPALAELMPHVAPAEWTEATAAARRAAFGAFAAKHGPMGLQETISGGQYEYPNGIFFGGKAPTWSHLTFKAIVEKYLLKARRVAFVDMHTGLGPYGHGELITMGRPGNEKFDRAVAWYGDSVTSPEAGTSTSAKLSGLMEAALSDMLPKAEVTPIAVEYGTYPTAFVMESLMADNWLHLNGDLASPLARRIKADIRKAFYPDEDDWKELVLLKARQVFRRAVNHIAS